MTHTRAEGTTPGPERILGVAGHWPMPDGDRRLLRAWSCAECDVLWKGPSTCWLCGGDGQFPTESIALLAM
jgi:hypothetical protein